MSPGLITPDLLPSVARPSRTQSAPPIQREATICQLLYALNMGGAEVLAARLARGLRRSYRFLFVCLDELGSLGKELRAEGFPVEVVGRRPGVDWRCSIRLGKLLRRWDVDLVHAHQYAPFFYGLTARLLFHRPPILFTEHGRSYPDHPRPKRIVANRLLLERRDRVVGVGKAVRQALIHNEGIPSRRIEVVYNGIDLAHRGAGANLREVARQEMGVGPNDLVIIQVARLDSLKDHGTALRMLEVVRRQRADARLILVGEGPERERIERQIRRLELAAHVRLLGMRTDVARLLPGADVLLLSSISEGIPLTVIEGMAAGLPVVATRVGGLPEVVEDGVTGLLVSAGDHEGLAAQILKLAVDPMLRQRLGQAGSHRALERFFEARMHSEYRRLYDEMLDAV
jgi:glycosyltransferase involved in cell wall biosynthesis